MEGAALGVLHVGTVTPREFTNADAALLQLAAAQAAPAIDRARLFDALDREHRNAVALQRSLLPDRMPDLVRHRHRRALPAGRATRWAATGTTSSTCPGATSASPSGMSPAMDCGPHRSWASCAAGLRAYALEGHSPGETLKRLDRMLQTISGRGDGHRRPMRSWIQTTGDAALRRTRVTRRRSSSDLRRDASLMEATPAPPLGSLPFSAFHETEERLDPRRHDPPLHRRPDRAPPRAARRSVSSACGRWPPCPATAEQLCQRVTEQLVPAGGGDDDIAVVALRVVPVEATLRVRFAADPQILSQMRRMLGRWLQEHGARLDEIAAITLACGEACANAIEHAYAPAWPTSSSRRCTRTGS